jgi:hypothetical protein
MSNPTFYAFGGIRTTLDPERLGRAVRQRGGIDQRTDLVAAINIDLDDSGRASRRAGQTRVAAGAAHSLYAAGATCLYVQDGVLRRLNPDYSSVALQTGLGAAPLRYVSVNGAVYWSDGTRSGAVVDGVAAAWGMAIPPAQPAARVVAGQLPAGHYQYALTWLAEDGQESGTGPAAQVQLAVDGGGLVLTWAPPRDPRIARAALYLSEPDGTVLYRALVADAGAGSATVRATGAALALATQWLDAPPPGQDLSYHRGRIWIASGAHLFATSALGYGYCDLRDYLALDGSAIRFVAGLEHGLYVGTGRAVYYLAGDSFADMTLNSVVDGFGVAGSAVVVDGFAATADAALAGTQCLLFACALGVCLGKPDGSVVNLTYDRYRSNMDLTGSAVLRTEAALTQYLLAMHD